MKKNILILAVISLFLSTSCEKEIGNIENLKGVSLPAEVFFEKIISENAIAKEGNIFYISYDWDAKNKTFKVTNVNEREPDFIWIPMASGSKNTRVAGGYKVTCTKGGKDLWTKECNSSYKCGTIVLDCLSGSGGCATVCEKLVIYDPKTQDFYLI